MNQHTRPAYVLTDTRNLGGFLLYSGSMPIPYSKLPKTPSDQVQLLISRGLKVSDVGAAESFLSRHSYYRFSGYVLPFESPRHAIRPGVTFEQVRHLCLLDEKLRCAMFACLAPVEVMLRARVTNAIALNHGVFGQHSPSIFRQDFDHVKWCDDLEKETNRSKETFVEHFMATYVEYPKLPIWAAVEVVSMGTLSFLYKGLLQPTKEIIADGLVHPRVLNNWFHFLSYLRNTSAHHARLWNRKLSIRPDLLRKEWASIPLDSTRPFVGIAVMEWLSRKGGLNSGPIIACYDIFKELITAYPYFALSMGIPSGWSGGMLW